MPWAEGSEANDEHMSDENESAVRCRSGVRFSSPRKNLIIPD